MAKKMLNLGKQVGTLSRDEVIATLLAFKVESPEHERVQKHNQKLAAELNEANDKLEAE